MDRGPLIDRLATSVANLTASRRSILAAGAAAAAAVTLNSASSARQATPSSESTPDGFGQTFLFVQTFSSGSVKASIASSSPVADAPGEGSPPAFTLSLDGHSGRTIYFSDRPERITGDVATEDFLGSLGFNTIDPPNAALVVDDEAGNTIVAILELTNPVYDEAVGSIDYDAAILAEYATEAFDHLVQQHSQDPIPSEFGAASLFLDDCADLTVKCADNQGPVGEMTRGMCWNWSHLRCERCTPVDDNQFCNEHFAVCSDECNGCAVCDGGNEAVGNCCPS